MDKKLIIDVDDIQPSRKDFQVLGVFNPAITRYKDGYIMIARVAETPINKDDSRHLVVYYDDSNRLQVKEISKEDSAYDFSDLRVIRNSTESYLTSISHFRVAYSEDKDCFDFNEAEILKPSTPYEAYGIEDPRITAIGDSYYITYTAVSPFGINSALMRTKDFKGFERLGNIFHADNKDCVLFPKKVNDRFMALHRPSGTDFAPLDIWSASSCDLIGWGDHKVIKNARITYTESERVGGGAVPILTDKGWLVIYHSANSAKQYHLAAMVLDKEDVTKVLMRSKEPLLYPEKSYETEGFVNDVVFTCGVIENPSSLDIYYGACDKHIARCTMQMEEIWNNMEGVEHE